MASAWGKSWGASWGSSWGFTLAPTPTVDELITAPGTGGGVSFKARIGAAEISIPDRIGKQLQQDDYDVLDFIVNFTLHHL